MAGQSLMGQSPGQQELAPEGRKAATWPWLHPLLPTSGPAHRAVIGPCPLSEEQRDLAMWRRQVCSPLLGTVNTMPLESLLPQIVYH